MQAGLKQNFQGLLAFLNANNKGNLHSGHNSGFPSLSFIGFINEFVGVWRKHSENESKNTDLNKLIGNSKYIESCYQYAYGVKSINPNDLDNWRLLMLKRFFVSLLVRFSLKSNQNEFNYINKLLKSEYEDVFLNINSDFKYKLFKLIKHSKILTSFAFKYFLKQESFLEDNI